MHSECGCTPGTHNDGWHEQRSDVCAQAERDRWRDMMQRLRSGEFLKGSS